MKRRLFLELTLGLSSLAGCLVGNGGAVAGVPVGAPCAALQPPRQAGASACGDAGCFQRNEVYLETNSGQCGAGACVVYHWDQAAHPEERSLREQCSCRCDGPTPCTCAPGYRCTLLFAAPEATSLCVPEAAL